MLAWAERLPPQPAGSRIAFRYSAQPAAVVLDLAIQRAGLVSAPVSGPPQERGERAWVAVEDFEVGEKPGSAPARAVPAATPAGGAIVLRAGEAMELTPAELAAMAAGIEGEIQPGDGREIIVLGGPLEHPAERAILAWATVSGAAVVLEPNPALLAATAAWVRPTVFHGTVLELAALRRWVEKGRRRPRLPFRRLRTVLLGGPQPPAAGDEAFWHQLGVRIRRVG